MSLTTINFAKLPKTATPNSVFYCGDTGKAYVAGPDGKVVAVDKLLVLAQGPKGEQGPKGDKGEDSYLPGPVGPKGDRGERGVQGQGAKGNTGSGGPRGIRGEHGPKGERGERGEQGDKGERGEQGVQGLRGDVLYCTDAEVKKAADELHAHMLRFRAAALDALRHAQGLKTHRITASIIKTLIERTK